MVDEAAQAPFEACRAALDRARQTPGGFKEEVKIDNNWLAGLVVAGALSLGAYYLSRRQHTDNAIRNALERNEDGVVDPEARRIANGSILVELFCHTEKSFLSFMDDFEAKRTKLRLEEEFRKIGYEEELDVAINNSEEVYHKAYQLR